MQHDNPWTELNWSESELVTDRDRDSISALRQRLQGDGKLRLTSIPEPYIGGPTTAKLVLLSLNPGHDDRDSAHHLRPDVRDVMRRNLLHDENKYPFYPLDPIFAGTGVGEWWTKRLGKLAETSKLSFKELSQKVLAIEWFPYHSKKAYLPLRPEICPSQSYSFQLAQRMIEEGKLVIFMRSVRYWKLSNPVFDSSELDVLKSPRCAHVSPGNTSEQLFKRIQEAVQS